GQPKSPAIIYDSDVEIVGTENGCSGAASASTPSTRGGKVVARGRVVAVVAFALVPPPVLLLPSYESLTTSFQISTYHLPLFSRPLSWAPRGGQQERFDLQVSQLVPRRDARQDCRPLRHNNEWVNGVLSQVQNILANYSDAVNVGSSTRATLTDIRSEILRRVHLLSLDVRFLEVLFAEYDRIQAHLEKELPPLEEKDLPSSSVESPASLLLLRRRTLLGATSMPPTR
ncbi:hypothetical protein CC2G_000001, partial [Coprinopsis cinerea AmutBmut pab1-1]